MFGNKLEVQGQGKCCSREGNCAMSMAANVATDGLSAETSGLDAFSGYLQCTAAFGVEICIRDVPLPPCFTSVYPTN